MQNAQITKLHKQQNNKGHNMNLIKEMNNVFLQPPYMNSSGVFHVTFKWENIYI